MPEKQLILFNKACAFIKHSLRLDILSNYICLFNLSTIEQFEFELLAIFKFCKYHQCVNNNNKKNWSAELKAYWSAQCLLNYCTLYHSVY